MSEQPPDPATFTSGGHGTVSGPWQQRRRRLRERAYDLRLRARGALSKVDHLAVDVPAQKVLAVGPYRPNLRLAQAVAELRRTKHDVRLAFGSRGEVDDDPGVAEATVLTGLAGGKWDNTNAVIEAAGGLGDAGWLFVVDDDVVLPERFVDRFVALCRHFDLALAQPAQSLTSHAAWDVARRHGGSLVRETRFVEIGPVTAFRRDFLDEIYPFPELRWGWGLDLHWAALAAERGRHIGVVDALPVEHSHAPVADDYSSAQAIEEAQRFLTGKPYVHADEAKRTLVRHRVLRPRT